MVYFPSGAFLQTSIILAIYTVFREMSTEKRNPFKRDQALSDATSGQMGKEPKTDDIPYSTGRWKIPGRKLLGKFHEMCEDRL
jgi:hypothetical protein